MNADFIILVSNSFPQSATTKKKKKKKSQDEASNKKANPPTKATKLNGTDIAFDAIKDEGEDQKLLIGKASIPITYFTVSPLHFIKPVNVSHAHFLKKLCFCVSTFSIISF